MSEKYKFRNPSGIYFITITIVGWIDLFTKPRYCDIIIDALKHSQKEKGLIIHAWCIMSSHLHLIVSSNGKEELSAIVRDFKKFTSRSIIEEINNSEEGRKDWLLRLFEEAGSKLKRITHYKIWQDGNHPIELDTNQMKDQRLKYLHENPVKQGFVYQPEDYCNSSAVDYSGGHGLIDVDLIQ